MAATLAVVASCVAFAVVLSALVAMVDDIRSRPAPTHTHDPATSTTDPREPEAYRPPERVRARRWALAGGSELR